MAAPNRYYYNLILLSAILIIHPRASLIMNPLLDTCLVRNPDLVAAEVDGETVMISIEKGEYYGLNAVGSRIWELLEAPSTINDLCDQLLEEFDIDVEQCRAEVLTFASELLEQDVIMPC